MLSINTEVRDVKQKPSSFRKKGLVPAVSYGPKDTSMSLVVDKKEFMKIWKEAGESTLLTLTLKDQKQEVLIHGIDIDPVTSDIIHIDFYIPEKGKKVEVSVPLMFVGVSNAVKELKGLLVKVMHDIEIEGLPKDLPHEIEVDISALTTLQSQILIKDIKLPIGIRAIPGEDEVVAAISIQEEETEDENAHDIGTIEVEKKGKKEAEGSGEDS